MTFNIFEVKANFNYRSEINVKVFKSSNSCSVTLTQNVGHAETNYSFFNPADSNKSVLLFSPLIEELIQLGISYPNPSLISKRTTFGLKFTPRKALRCNIFIGIYLIADYTRFEFVLLTRPLYFCRQLL